MLWHSEHEWTPPQSLTDFLNNGSKPIYIGFGSIVVADPDELTRIIVEAVKLSGVRVILSKGWSGRMQKQEKEMVFPDSIYRIDRIPHDWLFPQCQAVMHHGGAGTTSAGLRAGVPTIVKPFFGDQFFWADRVQDLGVGISLRKMTVQKLSQALLSISNDTKIQGKAKLMGERIRAENGVQNAIQFVYRDLELAQQGLSDLKLKEKLHTWSHWL
ncbi:hypothetical protein EDD86DRAFT_257740 [Gorgonomyces haynaldii]|nr:hypothetical protein EDD86DRAFT_257740 [Gorgonomyces haynaldii]